MADPQGNTAEPGVGTPLLNGYQWKGTLDWLSALPPLLNGRGAEDKVANRVLSNLASRADHKTGRNAYPSNAWLAERCHVSERSVRSALARLEDAKRIERDGLSRHGTVRWRLRFEYDVPAGWLPIDAREEHKRALHVERQRRYREKLISEAKCVTQPAEQAEDLEAKCVTAELISEAKCVTSLDVTQPASDDLSLSPPVQETTQGITAVAAAPPVGLEVIDAELVDEATAPSLPVLPVAVPSTAVALRLDRAPAASVDTEASELDERPQMLPNLSEAWLLPEPLAEGKRPPMDAQLFDASEWPLPQSSHTVTEWTKLLVDRWSAACIEQNRCNPSGRQFGQAGKEIRALIAAGNNPNHVAMAVDAAGARCKPTIMWSMQDVRPLQSWQQARPGRQIVSERGSVTLPEGTSAGDRRAASILLAGWEA